MRQVRLKESPEFLPLGKNGVSWQGASCWEPCNMSSFLEMGLKGAEILTHRGE